MAENDADEAAAPELARRAGGSATERALSSRRWETGRRWGVVVAVAIPGAALIDFIVENTRSVRVSFFTMSGHIPVAVALLAAAFLGALVFGVARAARLRLSIRSVGRKRAGPADPGGES